MKDKANLKPMRPLDLILKESWYLFAANWLKFLLFSLLSTGAVILIFVIYLIPAGIYLAGKDWSGYQSTNFDWQGFFSGMALPAVIYGLIGIILFVLLVTLIDLATAHYVYHLAKKESLKILDSYRYGIKNLFAYFWVHLLVFLVVLLGFCLLVIPAFYVVIVLSLVTPVCVVESKKGFATLKRSRELIKGYFWPVTGRLAFLILLSIAASILQETAILAPLAIIAQFILTFYGIIYLLLIYSDLASLKGGQSNQPVEEKKEEAK